MKKTEAISILATSVRPREAKDRVRYDEAVKIAIETLKCSETPKSSDYISRRAAIDALAKFVPYAICDESTESYTNGLTDAYNLILQLPCAQTERKKGKWIEDDYAYTHCSVCGMEWDEPEHPPTNYCPNCGAEMRGGDVT